MSGCRWRTLKTGPPAAVSPIYALGMEIFAVLVPLAAEEKTTTTGIPLWLTLVLAILLLWVLAAGLLIWVLRRRS